MLSMELKMMRFGKTRVKMQKTQKSQVNNEFETDSKAEDNE